MKISKTTVLGLGILSALAVLLIAVPVKSALAATVSSSDLTNATYKFLDGGNISADIGGQTIVFTDKDPTSNPKNYIPDGTFCDPGGGNYGINIANNVDMTAKSIRATIHVGNQVGARCNPVTDQDPTISITNDNALAATDYQWDGAGIKSLNGSSNPATLDQVRNGNDVAFGETGGGSCGYDKFILLNSANGNTGKYYELRQRIVTGKGSEPENLPAELKTYLDPANCYLTKGPINITLAGKEGQAAAGGSGNTASAGDSCDLDANGLSLAWLMCPLLAAANDLVNGSDQSGTGGLLGLYQDQLSFNVNRDLGVTGGGGNKVQTTWSLIKNIATAILVIIMLIAIFSQSISAGPFDAYTIRKILPRLVAAAILIQLSWYITAWVVDLVNDIGNSLFYLLYAPFGGSDKLQLGHLLANGGVGGGSAAAINYLVILPTLVVLGLAALPTVLFMAFSAIVAVFTALVVLVFRKIIIIVCLIFAPLAILAWILPGTQRYWKMWSDNFIKVLFMYPLIVALIAAGHIFAYIAGTQNNGVFLNFILITIGVFGPLFILPKTFKWGGQFMSLAGGAITGLGDKTRQAGKEPITGWTKRKVQGNFAKKYAPKGAPGSTWRNRTMNSLLGGRVIPTKYRAAILTQSGDKWNEERDAEAQALLKRKGETAMKLGYTAGLLTDDKKSFAKYKTLEGDDTKLVDKDGKVILHKKVDPETGDTRYYKDAEHTQMADDTDMKNAVKIKVGSYDEADKKRLTGVSAMKQMWVDLADSSENPHERKMAVRQLTATSSWPEIQGSLSRKGNRLLNMEAWANSITTSPEDYPKVLRSRVDGAPHIDNSAKAAAESLGLKGQAFTDYREAHRMVYAIKDQMSNEDFNTQSEGLWTDMDNLTKLADDEAAPAEVRIKAAEIREELVKRFKSIEQAGPTAAQSHLSHLVGGSIQEKVDHVLMGKVLARDSEGKVVKDASGQPVFVDGDGKSVIRYIQDAGGRSRPARGGASPTSSGGTTPVSPGYSGPPPGGFGGPGRPPATGGGATITEDGIDLHPDDGSTPPPTA